MVHLDAGADTSRQIDLAARPDKSRWIARPFSREVQTGRLGCCSRISLSVDLDAGADKYRLVDMTARADQSGWVDLATGADKSRQVDLAAGADMSIKTGRLRCQSRQVQTG